MHDEGEEGDVRDGGGIESASPPKFSIMTGDQPLEPETHPPGSYPTALACPTPIRKTSPPPSPQTLFLHIPLRLHHHIFQLGVSVRVGEVFADAEEFGVSGYQEGQVDGGMAGVRYVGEEGDVYGL